jgi:hypothetical protein
MPAPTTRSAGRKDSHGWHPVIETFESWIEAPN